MVHGWLLRVETGFIEELTLDETVPEELAKVFNLKFKLDKSHHLIQIGQ